MSKLLLNQNQRRVSSAVMAAPMEMGESDNLSSVKHIIVILSGKGGVGKSTIATQLALALRSEGNKVGLLDVDICGPSIPKMLNLHDKEVFQCSDGWVPVFVDQEQTLGVMSIGFLLHSSTDAVVWRGPKKNAMIKQFLRDVYWRHLDYLIIDTPPGTSDEHLSVIENIRQYNPDGAVLVTTPQAVSTGDVRREATFCKKTGIPVIGIVENMSGFVCPHCSECSNVFSKGGGEALATQLDVPFLGCVPLDPQLTQSLEDGKNFLDLFPESATRTAVQKVTSAVLEQVQKKTKE